jgi:hypothetical protein
MQTAEITSFLDDRISDLAKTRLAKEPVLPGGHFHYASFMIPHEEIVQDKMLQRDGWEGKAYRGREDRPWGDGNEEESKDAMYDPGIVILILSDDNPKRKDNSVESYLWY